MSDASLASQNCAGRSQQEPASLLVFADDWGRHPSSCQHLVRELIRDWPVCWVNTIGTRAPKFNLATVRRAFEKLFHWTKAVPSNNTKTANPKVVSPMMWPWFQRGHDRWLNRTLLSRKLDAVVRQMPQPVAAITTLPITADLVGALPVDRWIYYCVDDFSKWPGLDQRTMEVMERELIAKVDDIVSVSDDLRERIDRIGRGSTLLTHGVDLNHWRNPGRASRSDLLSGFERPLITFWGLIDRRLDVEFVEQLSQRLAQGTILLLGPTDDSDPRLYQLPRVVHAPAVDYTELPAFASNSAVLVMPYADLDVTRAMQPLKLKEYMATGCPVVVRDLPSTRPWYDCLDIATNATEFAELVVSRISTGITPNQVTSRQRLEREGWAQKAEELRAVICGRVLLGHKGLAVPTELACR